MPKFAVLVFGLLGLGILGCSDDEPSPIRGNVVEILSGGLWEDSRCSEQHAEYCCREQGLTACTTFDSLSLVAVRSAGSRVGALVLANGIHLTLALSEDRGATWSTIAIDDTDFVRGGPAYVGNTDLVVTATGTWIYIPRPEEGAGGRTYSRGYLYRVDPATGKLSDETQNMPGAPPIETRDGRAIFVVPDRDFRGGPLNLLTSEVDPTNRAADRSGLVECASTSCDTLSYFAFQGTDDGDNYYGFTHSVAPSPECLVGYNRTSQSLTMRCIPYSEWPGTLGDLAVLPYADSQSPVLRAFDRAGHAWAATILDNGTATGTVSVPVDLGPGSVFPNGSFSGWPRHRGMAIVTPPPSADPMMASTEPTRLVRVPRSGPAQDVVLPTTPCEAAAGCGYRAPQRAQVVGQIAWTESLGNDEYLVFYSSDLEPALNKHRASISVALERATYRDIAPGEPLAIDGAVGYPTAIDTDGVARMCARALSCAGGLKDDVLQCIRYWTGGPTLDAAKHHAALLSFLASPPGCSGFSASPSNGFISICNGLEPACGRSGGDCMEPGTGGGSASCDYTAAVADCNTCTPDGRAITCNGSTITSVLDCAAVGQTCAGSPPSCVAAPCSTTGCLGDIWTDCSTERDCAALQMSCTAAPFDPNAWFNGCAPSTAGGCADTVWCDGKYLMVCLDGQPQSFDCTTMGFAGCGFIPDTNSPRCHP